MKIKKVYKIKKKNNQERQGGNNKKKRMGRRWIKKIKKKEVQKQRTR